MRNDKTIRLFFIPLLGVAIPLLSGFYDYSTYPAAETFIANIYFIFISYCVWQGSRWLMYHFRERFAASPFYKIPLLCIINVLYAATVASILSAVWFLLTSSISWQALYKNTAAVSLAVIVFTLVYEIMFLTDENAMEHSKAEKLDTALTKAQLTILKNELDPHFMYNALNTLSHLIKTNTEKADEFVMKLADIYKYFLLNKRKEYVSLEEELHFIDQYFSLLQLRYENKIHLQKETDGFDLSGVTILPCALQILVENAIKHNAFTEANPLHIKISINDESIFVQNTKRPGKVHLWSAKIGLSNLQTRYELACNKTVTIESGNNYFLVRLPLLRSA